MPTFSMGSLTARLKKKTEKVQATLFRRSTSHQPHSQQCPPSTKYSQVTCDASSSANVAENQLQDNESAGEIQEAPDPPPLPYSIKPGQDNRGEDGLLTAATSMHAPAPDIAPQDNEISSNFRVPTPETRAKDQVSGNNTTVSVTKTSTPDDQCLWTQALSKLNEEEQDLLHNVHTSTKTNSQTLFQSLEDSIKAKQLQEKARHWQVSIGGRTFIIRDVMLKIVEWLRRFKEIGDVAVSFDPVHAALPWAGFRFLLEVSTAISHSIRLYLHKAFTNIQPAHFRSPRAREPGSRGPRNIPALNSRRRCL